MKIFIYWADTLFFKFLCYYDIILNLKKNCQMFKEPIKEVQFHLSKKNQRQSRRDRVLVHKAEARVRSRDVIRTIAGSKYAAGGAGFGRLSATL